MIPSSVLDDHATMVSQILRAAKGMIFVMVPTFFQEKMEFTKGGMNTKSPPQTEKNGPGLANLLEIDVHWVVNAFTTFSHHTSIQRRSQTR